MISTYKNCCMCGKKRWAAVAPEHCISNENAKAILKIKTEGNFWLCRDCYKKYCNRDESYYLALLEADNDDNIL